LLEKYDWVFTSSSWALTYPDTYVQVLSRLISDHIPYVVNTGTSVPKAKISRFENYWMDFPDFLSIVDLHWNTSTYFANAAQTLNAKFQQVRVGLKAWNKELSKLSKLINNSNFVLALLDGFEDQRPLSNMERAFRSLVKHHLAKLLEAIRIYWKQRNTARWVKIWDENT
jgi:hypothetical protein